MLVCCTSTRIRCITLQYRISRIPNSKTSINAWHDLNTIDFKINVNQLSNHIELISMCFVFSLHLWSARPTYIYCWVWWTRHCALKNKNNHHQLLDDRSIGKSNINHWPLRRRHNAFYASHFSFFSLACLLVRWSLFTYFVIWTFRNGRIA